MDPKILCEIVFNEEEAESPFGSFVCFHCEGRWNTKHEIRSHIKETHKKNLDDPTCKEEDGYREHIIHEFDSFCDNRFENDINVMHNIILKFNKQKPHHCSNCEHNMCDTIVKRYNCPYCEHRDAQIGLLQYHIRTEHKGYKLEVPCPHCSYKTVHTGFMKRHLLTKHGVDEDFN